MVGSACGAVETALRGAVRFTAGNGEDTFHADLRQSGFHCFSCQAHGNVLDLVAALERCSLRQAALSLAEWFGVERWARLPELGVCVERKSELIRKKKRKGVYAAALLSAAGR